MNYPIFDILDFEEDESYPYQITVDMINNAQANCADISEEEIKNLLGRKWLSKTKTLYPLMLFIKKYTNESGVIYISQTDKKLLAQYNQSQSNIFDNIHYLLDCRVLDVLPVPYQTKKYAKHYYVSQNNLSSLLNIYNKECQKEVFAEPNKKTAREINAYFNSLLRLNADKYSESEIADGVYYHYPLIPYYQYLSNFLNNRIVRSEEKIRFNLSFNYSDSGKYITKIGIRATNNICFLKSFEKQQKTCERQGVPCIKDDNTLYREDYLTSRFGGEYEEYDIHASVPRVAHSMCYSDGMGDMTEDLYRTMFEQFTDDYKKYFNPSITEWNGEVRDFFKSFFMRLYFGGTPSMICNNIRSKEKENLPKFQEKHGISSSVVSFTQLEEQGVDVVGLIEKWQNAVSSYCPQKSKKDTSVFLDESCIYLSVRNMLYKMGIDVVQVYDGFYFKKGDMPDNMDEIVSLCGEIYKNAPRIYDEEEDRDTVISYADYIERFNDVDYQNDNMEKMCLAISDELEKKRQEIISDYIKNKKQC